MYRRLWRGPGTDVILWQLCALRHRLVWHDTSLPSASASWACFSSEADKSTHHQQKSQSPLWTPHYNLSEPQKWGCATSAGWGRGSVRLSHVGSNAAVRAFLAMGNAPFNNKVERISLAASVVAFLFLFQHCQATRGPRKETEAVKTPDGSSVWLQLHNFRPSLQQSR